LDIGGEVFLFAQKKFRDGPWPIDDAARFSAETWVGGRRVARCSNIQAGNALFSVAVEDFAKIPANEDSIRSLVTKPRPFD
jgi:hypothetical protein